MQPKHHYKLMREIKLMQVLRGPFVADLLDHFEDPDTVYLVLAYYSGGDLFKQMLVRGGALEEHWVCVEVRGGMASRRPHLGDRIWVNSGQRG